MQKKINVFFGERCVSHIVPHCVYKRAMKHQDPEIRRAFES